MIEVQQKDFREWAMSTHWLEFINWLDDIHMENDYQIETLFWHWYMDNRKKLEYGVTFILEPKGV